MPEQPFGEQHAYFSRLAREANAEREVAAAELASIDEALCTARYQVQVLEAKRAELQERSESRIRHALEPLTAWLASDPTLAALKRHNVEVGGVRFSWRAQSAKQVYEVAKGADGREDWDTVICSAPWATKLAPDRTALRERARIVGDTVVDCETGEPIDGLVVTTTEASVTYTAELGGQRIELGRMVQDGSIGTDDEPGED